MGRELEALVRIACVSGRPVLLVIEHVKEQQNTRTPRFPALLTGDGSTEQSAGLDLYDLAAYMLELGAVDAMNLDGGGSTTMFLDGKVVNRPSDKEGERKIGDAILVTLRNKRKQ